MAKRKSGRQTVQTPVKLYSKLFGEFKGVSRNISDSGLFIEIEPFVGLQAEKEQKLVFINSSNKRVIFNVKFVRDTDNGLAFKFIDFETAGQRYPLEELRNLRGAQKMAAEHIAA